VPAVSQAKPRLCTPYTNTPYVFNSTEGLAEKETKLPKYGTVRFDTRIRLSGDRRVQTYRRGRRAGIYDRNATVVGADLGNRGKYIIICNTYYDII